LHFAYKRQNIVFRCPQEDRHLLFEFHEQVETRLLVRSRCITSSQPTGHDPEMHGYAIQAKSLGSPLIDRNLPLHKNLLVGNKVLSFEAE
jgi:hypothetical protein